MLGQVVGQTAQAGARVYAIDVRGLNRGRGARHHRPAGVDDSFGGRPLDIEADGPNSLAVDTGGMMIRNENNIGRALDTFADDANRYYVIGYQPGDLNFDGRFRPVAVRVKRAGVRVRARRGYLALEPERMLDAGIAAFGRALAAAADEPLTYFNLGRAYEMRYSRTLRHLSSQRRAGTFSVEERRKALAEDRRKALEYYEQHVRREGPYADQAREAIKHLERAPGGTDANDHL